MLMDVFLRRLCVYDLRKGDLFVLSWACVRRVRWGSISSELLMCGGGVVPRMIYKKHIKMFQRLQQPVVELAVLLKDLKIGVAPFLP